MPGADCIPLRFWVDLPAPCPSRPAALAAQPLPCRFSQERADQIRSLLSSAPTVLPLRRVFGTRPTMRPYGPVRPAEPSSTAQLQATLKTSWRKLWKPCSTRRFLLKITKKNFGGHAVAVPPPFSYLCTSCVGDLLSLTLAHLSDFIAGCRVPSRGPQHLNAVPS